MQRVISRGSAAVLAASLLFFLANGVPQVLRQDDASLVGRIPAMVFLIAVPGGLAASLLWWAWRGWAIDPEPRWIVAIRWGMAGATMWAFLGTLGILAWFSLIVRGDAGLMPIVAFMSSPVGFVIGAVAGVVRRRS
jgi:hypothetical protein